MNFARAASIRPPVGVLMALLRSVRTEPLVTVEWERGPDYLELWWDPVVPVGRGDRVRCFPTPLGLGIEAVESTGAEEPPPS